MNPIALRLLNQQLIVPQFNTPEEVVSYMGAMQAQEYRMIRWAVAMRTRKPSLKAFKDAYDNGRIIRMHLMRGTWQLVSAEDYGPYLKLVCKLAYREGLSDTLLFANVKIAKGDKKLPKALDRCSLDKLMNLKFGELEDEMETARDLFVFACHT